MLKFPEKVVVNCPHNFSNDPRKLIQYLLAKYEANIQLANLVFAEHT
jgi:hypothetical protein